MVELFATNCYIVGSESNKEGMIIAPGAEAKKSLTSVKDLGLDIKFIVLTHSPDTTIGTERRGNPFLRG